MAGVGRDDLAPVVLSDAPHEIAAQYLDATKAHRQLGWKPSVGLEEGLRQTIEWYRALLT
jgi:nucleoside-diphosphate-sugar epimerase